MKKRYSVRAVVQAVLAMVAAIAFGQVATAQVNSPEVQRALEVAAAQLKGRDDGVLKVTETTIGDRSLVIRYQPSAGVKREKAASRMKDTAKAWASRMCTTDGLPDFLRRTGTKLTVEFEREPNAYVVEAEVTAAFCDGTTDIRMIDGKPLYPKPSLNAAMQVIRNHLEQTLYDYDSAKMRCSDMTPAVWVKFILQARKYGYLIECDINAKNQFGGYVGFQSHRYLFNGETFEELVGEPAFGFVDQ